MAVLLLSIMDEYAKMLLAGIKRWEFRQNPNFGAGVLQTDDVVFIISTAPHGGHVSGLSRVEMILKGHDIDAWFGDRENGHWREAGCDDGATRDWTFFSSYILGKYSVAIKLHTIPLEAPLALAEFVHSRTGKSWRGVGLNPLNVLAKYQFKDRPADEYLLDIVVQSGIISKK